MLKAHRRAHFQNKILTDGFGSDLVDRHIRFLNDGANSNAVDLCELNGKEVVRKFVKAKPSYQREKNNLTRLAKFPHSPNLLKFDDESRILVMDYCGIPLDKYGKKVVHRHIFLKPISQACYKLKHEFGLFHNDLRWKNLTFQNNQIFMVDFDSVGEIFKDADLDKIYQKMRLALKFNL